MSFERAILKLHEEYNTLVTELIQEYYNRKMHASGNWGRQLFADVREIGIGLIEASIIAPSYTKNMVEGTPPGELAPNKENITKIQNWIKDKSNFNVTLNGITLRQLAFFITRKINEEGSKRYREGGSDLIESVITPRRILSIINKVGQILIDDLVGEMRSDYNEIALDDGK